MKNIYLDYAAATPLDEHVLAAMQPYFSEKFYNPSATYLAAKSVATEIAGARKQIAGWLGARSNEIVFTAGGTEANNLAIHGVMKAFPGSNIIVSGLEHESVLRPASQYKNQIVPVNTEGIIRLDELEKLINNQTILVSVMYANNEIGTIQPLAKIATLVKNQRLLRQQAGNELPLYFHTDACQAAAYLDLHASRLGVDMMTINAGKIYGPKQCGALYVRKGTALQPQILGGGQERNMRSGTENVAGVIGLATALDLVQRNRGNETRRLRALQSAFLSAISQKLPAAIINGSTKFRLPNNIHLTIPGQDNERLVMELDEAGIQCAVGSACSASSDEPSHVLDALGLSEKAARSSLRMTMGKFTTQAELDRTLDTLLKLVA